MVFLDASGRTAGTFLDDAPPIHPFARIPGHTLYDLKLKFLTGDRSKKGQVSYFSVTFVTATVMPFVVY